MESSACDTNDASKIPKQIQDHEDEETSFDNFYSPYNRDFYNAYKYSKLDASRREIRLLRITLEDAKVSKTAPIRCELLENIPLTSMDGKFSTISYCAGNPHETEAVWMNGLPFNAFATLGHALRQARHFWNENYSHRECLLWADQICINQSNPLERSHQVDFMGEIYATAEQMFASLSKEGDCNDAVARLKQFQQPIAVRKDGRFQKADEAYLRDSDKHIAHANFYRAVVRVPYWKRAWVRQEYARSRRCHFLAAFEHFPDTRIIEMLEHEMITGMSPLWPTFHNYCKVLDSDSRRICHACEYLHSFQLESQYLAIQSFFQTKRIAQQWRRTHSLLDFIALAYNCQASDSKDLIYAFMGLSNNNFGLSADYTKETSLEDVFCQLARNVITSYGNLSLLHASFTRGYSERKIPSWVPVWPGIAWHAVAMLKKDSSIRQTVATFLPDEQGRANRILQVRGVPMRSSPSTCRNVGRCTCSPRSDPLECKYREDIWWIYGCVKLHVLKWIGSTNYELSTQEKRNEIMGGNLGLERIKRRAELIRMVEVNNLSVKTINIY